MIIWSKEYIDADGMFNADWTANGGSDSDATLDQWGSKQFNGDATNNSVSQTGIIRAADGDEQTVAGWWVPQGDAILNRMFYSQGNQSTNNAKILLYTSGPGTGIYAQVQSDVAGNRLNLTNISGLTDQQLHHVLFTWKGSTDVLKVYIDGQSAGTGTKTGTGYGGLDSDLHNTIVGSDSTPTSFMRADTSFGRLKVARAHFASDAEALEEYNAEVALLSSGNGEGLASPLVSPLADPVVGGLLS